MPLPVPGLSHFSDDQLWICTYAVLPAWIALAVIPRSQVREALVLGGFFICAVLYVLLMADVVMKGDAGSLDMGTLDGVKALLSMPAAALPAWLHYLAFDLFVANSLVTTNLSARNSVPQLTMVPVLVATLMAGPTGALLFYVARYATDLFRSAARKVQ